MKNRLHDKKAGIAILVALIIISVAEIIFRAVVMGEAVLTTSNLGEQLAVIALAVTILILTAKGKDRACYILYGAWIAYFVFDQIFELPGAIISFLATINTGALTLIPFVLRIVGRIVARICIIAIGALLVKYMNDGTIYNRAFNTLCTITVLAFIAYATIVVIGFVNNGTAHYWLGFFNICYNITMIFLSTFFAYDSAKMQLKKIKLAK